MYIFIHVNVYMYKLISVFYTLPFSPRDDALMHKDVSIQFMDVIPLPIGFSKIWLKN